MSILKSKQLNAFPFSGSGVITGSLNVTNAVTASYFIGDGSQLTGISAASTGVTIQDDGVIRGIATSLNFGANITASVSDNTASINVGASSGIITSPLEYYVDKRFSGSCEVTIVGNGIISSSNIGYITQFSASQAGNPNRPYPDPWSAKIAASASIATGSISSARIIIKTGNTYTYGSNTLVQNGDKTGSLSNNIRPDISISQLNYNSGSFYLISPSIECHFESSCSLYNINKSWQQMLAYYTSSNWTNQEIFKLTGKGKFVNVYGQNDGFVAKWGVLAAPSAEITFQADHIIQNMWQGWELIGQKVDISVDKLWSYNGFTFVIGDGGYNWPSASIVNKNINRPIVDLKINDFRYGINKFTGISPHADDWWANINIHSTYGSDVNININRFLATCITYNNGGLFRYSTRNTSYETNTRITSASNANINVNINYISASYTSSASYPSYSAGGPINTMQGITTTKDFGYANNYVNINVRKFDSWGLGFTGFGEASTNNTTVINCDEYTNYTGSGTDGLNFESSLFDFNLMQYKPSSLDTKQYINNKVTISGNYKNYAQGQTMICYGLNYTSSNENYGYTLFLNKFNAFNVTSAYLSGSVGVTGSILRIQTIVDNLTGSKYYYLSTGSTVVLQNSLLYQSGSTTVLNRTTTASRVIVNNTIMNTDFPAYVSAQGSFDLNTNLDKIVY